MDRNAIRHKKYAEMPALKKDELLRSQREARAIKKKQNFPLPRMRRVPLGYVESGVSFLGSDDRSPSINHETCTVSHASENRSLVLPADNAIAVSEGLEYMYCCLPISSANLPSSSSGKGHFGSVAPISEGICVFYVI